MYCRTYTTAYKGTFVRLSGDEAQPLGTQIRKEKVHKGMLTLNARLAFWICVAIHSFDLAVSDTRHLLSM